MSDPTHAPPRAARAGGRCTCGASNPGAGHYDETGHCRRGHHASCRGVLASATGFHWWCACQCHSEPEASPTARVAHNEAALRTWRAARAALTQAPADASEGASGAVVGDGGGL